MNSSYDVRIWKVSSYTGRRKTTYTVRWLVNGKKFPATFDTAKLADSFRSKLVAAARDGLPFDLKSGLPPTLQSQSGGPTWYEHACAYVDMKWPHAAARQRKSIAESIATVTLAVTERGNGAPDNDALRHALYTWAFNTVARRREPPTSIRRGTEWAAAHSIYLSEFNDAATVRRALDALAVKLDGKAAAPTTIARKRAVFYNALRYAVELGHLPSNPIDKVQWRTPKNTDVVDQRVVVNPTQARALLSAVRELNAPLEAFYACMYFAALRPAEALYLRANDCTLPKTGWGEILLSGSMQKVGRDWGETGDAIEAQGLKHRARNDTRRVPACPELVASLRRHIEEFGAGQAGRLFVTRTGRFGRPVAGPFGNTVSTNTYSRVWRSAREKVLAADGAESMLARRPYDLRHACVSLWLNAGVPATQVAEWAGHSVHVLMRVYAKCIYGQDEAARRRIEAALREADDQT